MRRARAALLHGDILCSEGTAPRTPQLLLCVNHFEVTELFTVQKMYFHRPELAIGSNSQK